VTVASVTLVVTITISVTVLVLAVLDELRIQHPQDEEGDDRDDDEPEEEPSPSTEGHITINRADIDGGEVRQGLLSCRSHSLSGCERFFFFQIFPSFETRKEGTPDFGFD
jgi:hypothetical protein